MWKHLNIHKHDFSSPTDPLVVLLLLDLVHLLHQLPYSHLQFRQLVFSGDLGVVVGVLAHLDVQVDPLRASGMRWSRKMVAQCGRVVRRIFTSMPPAKRENFDELECRQI